MHNRNFARHTHFPVRLALLMAGTALAIAAAFFLNLSDLRPFPAAVLTGLILLALVFCSALIAYFIMFIWRVLRRLHRAESSSVLAETGVLKASLTELARGNLSVRPETPRPEAAAAVASGRGVCGLLRPLVEAHRRIIAGIRTDIAEINQVSAPSCRRLFYVGADSLQEGRQAGRLMGRLLDGKGPIAICLGSSTATAQALRRRAFQKVLHDEFPGIEIVATRENHEDEELAARQTRELVAAHPDLAGIYVCHGSTPHVIARTAAAATGAGRLQIVTHDLTPPTMDCLARGEIAGTFSQSPFNQGFDAVVECYNYLVSGELPLDVRRITPLVEVTRDAWTRYWDPGRGEILCDASREALARPVANPSGTPHRIGVILPDDAGFWKPVADGVRQAQQAIREFGAEVTVAGDEEIRKTDGNASVFIPIVKRLVAAGCEAVCLPVFDPAIIAFLNETAANGTAIVTYNAEPVSLRGLIDAVSRHAGHLFRMSENLAAHSTENTQAVNQITATMKLLLVGSLNQIQHLSRTDDRIERLVQTIGRVREETGESLRTARLTTRTASAGYQIIRQAQETMRGLNRNARVTSAAIGALNENVVKIGEITHFIEEITARTNLLAINASIQAFQAGEGGQGFSVVAREIRSLAEQAGKATADIAGLIRAISSGVTRAAGSVETASAQVTASVALADRTESVFHEITAVSADNEAKVEGMLGRTEGMLGMSDEVRAAMAELGRLNQENGTAVEETTASILEMSKEISEIGEAARLLKEMGQSQGDLLSQFMLE